MVAAHLLVLLANNLTRKSSKFLLNKTMSILSLYLFWISFLLCLGTYAIYPSAIWFIGLLCPLKVDKKRITPFISIVISAFNEAKHIARKIENSLAVDYPEDRIEILVVLMGQMIIQPLLWLNTPTIKYFFSISHKTEAKQPFK